MSLTLFETFRQIDPFVKFTDGKFVATAGRILECVDPSDPTEYVFQTDGMGRLLIYRLDISGRAISPPAYVEEKSATPGGALPAVRRQQPNFGPLLHGFV